MVEEKQFEFIVASIDDEIERKIRILKDSLFVTEKRCPNGQVGYRYDIVWGVVASVRAFPPPPIFAFRKVALSSFDGRSYGNGPQMLLYWHNLPFNVTGLFFIANIYSVFYE